MSKFLLRAFVYFCCVFSVQNLYSQSSFFYYKQLGIKEGLSQSKVRCLLNDHKGYLWIGTEFGLNRYDRDHLKQYFHHPENDQTLPSNRINFIAEDSLCNLWVATISPIGICLYDRDNDNFKTLLDNNGKPVLITSYLLVEGGVLFGGTGSIYKYVYATKQLELVCNTRNELTVLNVPIWEMIRYDEETVLLNSQRSGIFSYNLKTNEVKKVEIFSAQPYYSSMYLDSHKNLWVSVHGDGLYCYREGVLFKHFTMSNSPLTYNAINDITEKDNQVWVATDGGGINIISLDDFSFSSILQTNDGVNSFPTNSVNHLYLDAGNNMWAGSIRRGLIGIKNVYAYSYQSMSWDNMYALSNLSVNTLFQAPDGQIWIGTDGGGINRFDPESKTFRHYATTKYEKVVSIAEYTSNELLFSSFNKGLFIFNKHTGQTRPFILINQEINDRACLNGYSVFFQTISENKILFTTALHLITYNATTRQFEIIATKGKEYERNSPKLIRTVGKKTYFLDLTSIHEYDFSKKEFKTIYKGNYTLNDACMDQNGTFWLASTEGLLHYTPQTRENSWIKTIFFQEATSVIADRQNRLWIGTRHHLYVYSPDTEKTIIVDEGDGVLPNEYIPNSTLITQSGDILFGGVMGMTLVNSAIHFAADTEQKVELLDILLDGLPAPVENRGEAIGTIRVPWDFSSLQLKVLLNDRDVFRENIFRFHIKELNQEQNQSNTNTLVINYLPTGKYTITTSYYTKNGEWSPQQEILHISVIPPWWKTSWFYAGICILVGLLTYWLVSYLLRKKKIKQRREIMQLKNKMNEEKISFLTNISHELRTPLTLICAPLKRIIDKKVEDKEIEKLLPPIYKQAYQMKNIIDMVLDMRKLEEGKDTLHVLPHSFNEWVHAVGEKFTHEFEAKGINLRYEWDERIEKVPFDKHKCELVLSNFLMNALKFSESGTVTIVSTHLSEEEDWVRVSVQDEGMGLSLVDTESLFSNFYQGAHDKGGSGIGLSYAKSLITLHKGKIGASSAPDKGAVFYFELPLSTVVGTSLDPVHLESEKREADHIDYTCLNKFSVIVVEDTTDLRNYLKDALAPYFNRIYVAKDGINGLEQIKQHLPDIIISDVMMPRLNGFELCQRVKTDLDISHIPFILLTAYHNSQNMYTGYKTGADAFLPKPFEIDGLLALCHNQLKTREQIRSRYKENNTLSYKEVSFSNADETFLLKLDTLISDNMSSGLELDVAFLATNMCISRSLLFNKVKTITGMGIIDYVNKQRIDKSIVLMNTTLMNITEISEMVGFSSLRYFSKVFKSIVGETPSNYRKQDK